jgi:hypothetical protein
LEAARSGLLIAVSSRPPFSKANAEELRAAGRSPFGCAGLLRKIGFPSFSQIFPQYPFQGVMEIEELRPHKFAPPRISKLMFGRNVEYHGFNERKTWKFIFRNLGTITACILAAQSTTMGQKRRVVQKMFVLKRTGFRERHRERRSR